MKHKNRIKYFTICR